MIQIENTPNPNALKFLSKNKISDVGTVEFQKNKKDKIQNSFIKSLLGIKGVELVLLSDNFISVKKDETSEWDSIKPIVISYLNDYFEKNNKPILVSGSADNENINPEKIQNQNETIQKINEVLETKIKPAVARDGGDIKFVSFEKGIVTVELRGSCSGCPSSTMTLKKGVQNLLKHYVEGVVSVEAI